MRTTPAHLTAAYHAKGWWSDITLGQLFNTAVNRGADRRALIDPPNRLSLVDFGPSANFSFAALKKAVDNLRYHFANAGLKRDDILVVQLPNTHELLLVYLAAAESGLIVSPLPMQYAAHELTAIINSLDPAAYITLRDFRGAPFLEPRRGAVPDTVQVLLFGPTDDTITAPSLSETAKPIISVPSVAVHGDDIFTICWTSGTTGKPKGVPRSHNHWTTIANGNMAVVDIRDHDRLLCPFPFINMASIGGFLYNWLSAGCSLSLHHPLDLEVYLGQIAEERITYTIAPPAVLTMLLKNEALLAKFDFSNVKKIASGGAPLSPWMISEFHNRYGIEVFNMFGSNEGMCLIGGAQDVPDPTQRAELFPRFGVDGLSWSNPLSEKVRSKLIDLETGVEITTPGQPGELLIAGPTIFDGYWHAPEDNAHIFTDDYFFHSGDVFEIDRDDPKFYRFLGRAKDIIVRGGMKISPDEIDTLLAGHPKLADVAVVGLPDPIMEERVCAFAVPKPGETVTLEDITQYLQDKGLAVFKMPERLEIVQSLPRNPLGKVLRRDLKKRVHA